MSSPVSLTPPTPPTGGKGVSKEGKWSLEDREVEVFMAEGSESSSVDFRKGTETPELRPGELMARAREIDRFVRPNIAFIRAK